MGKGTEIINLFKVARRDKGWKAVRCCSKAISEVRELGIEVIDQSGEQRTNGVNALRLFRNFPCVYKLLHRIDFAWDFTIQMILQNLNPGFESALDDLLRNLGCFAFKCTDLAGR